MKLALFFCLSLAVHALALAVPLSLKGSAPARAIVVTVLPLESAHGPSGNGNAKKTVNVTAHRATDTAPNPSTVGAQASPSEAPSSASDKIVTSIVGIEVGSQSTNHAEISSTGTGAAGSNATAARTGTGSGNGEGTGSGPAGAILTQARYRDTPQPHYPDSARRAGKEGRVLLRVLVDQEGRAKAIEINSSSGHDLLDQAASEALKKWRFVPAHADGRPIETWVKVPIEFQLSNNNR